MLYHAQDTDSENDILFTAYEDMIQPRLGRRRVEEILDMYEIRPGEFLQRWDQPTGRLASHDNITAIVYFSIAYALDFHKRIKVKNYPHPRDFCFLLAQRHWIYSPLLIVYGLIMIHTCWRFYYASNGKIDTDGKLLYILRREVQSIPVVDEICHWLLSWRYGKFYVHALFALYFEDPELPIRRMLKWPQT